MHNCILAAVQPPFATHDRLWDSGDMAFQGCIVKPYTEEARIASITRVFLLGYIKRGAISRGCPGEMGSIDP